MAASGQAKNFVRSKRVTIHLIALGLVVGAATAAAHWPVLSTTAILFDDDMYVADNELVRHPSLHSAGRFLSEIWEPSTVEGYYQPFAMISLMLDCALGGGPENLRPFHVTSLAFHVLNACLVFAITYVLFGHLWAAAWAGMVFGVHPINVDSVAWIAERKTLLAAFFAFGSLLCYCVYAKSECRRDDDPPLAATGKSYSRIAFVLSVVFFVFALLSKPTAVPLPVVMLLLDIWPLGRRGWRLIVEKIPLFALAAASAIVTIISQGRTASITKPTELPAGWVPLTVCHNVMLYFQKVFWPTDLSSFYDYPKPFTLANPVLVAGVIVTCILIVGLCLSLRWTKMWAAGGLLFFVAISPTIGIVGFQDAIAGDRFVYLPMLGLLMPFSSVLGKYGDAPGATTRRRAVSLIGGVFIVVLLAAATRAYLVQWLDGESIHRWMLRGAPNGVPVHSSYGCVLQKQRRYDEAIREFKTAFSLDSGFTSVHINIGQCEEMLGNVDAAMRHYGLAQDEPKHGYMARNNLALCLAEKGKLEEAVAHLRRAVAMKPTFAVGHNNLGLLLMKQGDNAGAMEQCMEAIRLQPHLADAHSNLGVVLMNLGKADRAIHHFREAIRLNETMLSPRFNLGCLLMRMGRSGEAIVELREAKRIDPADKDVQQQLDAALAARP